MQIKDTPYNEFLTQLASLFTKIAALYGLKECEPGFIGYFANVLKKHFGFLTFEQIEMAFEYNAIGSLNEFLPKKGFGVDNKVDYTIPDMIKIIRAYAKLKNIDNAEKSKECTQSIEKIIEIHRLWCNELIGIFEKYMDNYERSHITLPKYTCQVLAQIGQLDPNLIDEKEFTINIKLGYEMKQKRSTENENLIYATFDKIIGEGNHLNQLLFEFRNKYNTDEMPV